MLQALETPSEVVNNLTVDHDKSVERYINRNNDLDINVT